MSETPSAPSSGITMTKVVFWFVAFLIGVIGLCYILSTIIGPNRPQAYNPPPAPTPLPPGVGEVVFVGKTTWEVVDATTKSAISGQYGDVRPGGVFIVVETRVKNSSTTAETLLAPNLEDDAGRTYEVTTDLDAAMANEDQCTFERMNPGTIRFCTFIYDVSRSTSDLTGWRLKTTDMAGSGIAKDILLVKVAR